MSEAILLLRLEHRHADDLLKLIEQQLALKEMPLDLDLLRSISDYFLGYPDKCHHPIEDMVFRKLQARDADAAAQVDGLIEEHEDVAGLATGLATELDAAEKNGAGADSDLSSVLSEFVKRYRAHMYSEEELFFPLALEKLTDTDWSEIEYDLFDREDPLFDRAAEERFRRLRARIEANARESWQRARYLRRARRLRNLTSIGSFNELMSRAGTDYRLTEQANGSFSLERDTDVVIDIPRCSESRAVWCAYYFLESTLGQQIAN